MHTPRTCNMTVAQHTQSKCRPSWQQTVAAFASLPRGQVNKSHINSQIIPTNSIANVMPERPRLQVQPPSPATPTCFCNALQVNAFSCSGFALPVTGSSQQSRLSILT